MDKFPEEYLRGIELFNERHYYEAHEAWEDIWRASQGETRLFYQGLIQAAAALLHYDRRNPRGVNLCIRNSLAKLESLPTVFMSLDLAKFTATLRNFVADAMADDRGAKCENADKPHPKIELL